MLKSYDFLADFLPQVLPLPLSLHLDGVGLQAGYLALFSPFCLPQGLYPVILPTDRDWET